MKKCILTIINKEYLSFFEKFLHFYKKYSSIDLIVLTLNFDLSNQSCNKIKYIPYLDENIQEFETLGSNFYIRNFSDKYKYIAGLKPKLVNFSLSFDYDLFFYIDADCLIFPNFDNFFKKFNSRLDCFPLCPYYIHDFMIYNGIGNPFSLENFNQDLTLEAKLINLLNFDCNRTKYRSTFCFIYDKSCKNFFKEAHDIIFNMDLFKFKEIYFPLLDETVFNILFWKNKQNKSLNLFPCVDFSSVFKNKIENFNLFQDKDKLALLHVKFYKKFFDSVDLNNFEEIDHDQYNEIERSFSNHICRNLFYAIKNDLNTFFLNFTVLNSEKFTVFETSCNVFNIYFQDLNFFHQNLSYYVQINKQKNQNIQLIFKDENDNIIYYIDEIFNS